MSIFFSQLATQLSNQRIITLTAKATHENYSILSPLLSLDEQARANRYLHQKDRYLSSIAHGLKRLVISKLLNAPPASLDFSTKSKGKPFCAHPYAPEFNITHSQEWVAICLAQEAQVGVDLEFPQAINYTSLAKSVMTETEYLAYESGEFIDAIFIETWCRKEALAKACGVGLYKAMTSIETLNSTSVTIDGIDYYVRSKAFFEGFIAVSSVRPIDEMTLVPFDHIKAEL